ncbi:peptide/nickel transport system permease protein [Thermocatellispora tengchongensis]|uniref:Peptide/nickel transport system permease protein n=1 Tax=Thermocatellispora tengchongensis TaxID=1073253 RepID=A0A840PP69_9ACTN|nr:ABC transporter permease [Thermocatellispora tengchongensis]MBB5138867.1 peptide/nickel transport system permease protein [Thermocatellispora tengchongensis]
MARRAARRIGLILFVLWGAATLAFAGLRLVPGDPARIIAGGVQASASPAVLDAIRAEYGLDRPWPVQYLIFMGRLLRADLGASYQLNRPVAEVIGEQLGATLALAAGAVAGGLALAVALAVLTAGRPRARALARALEFCAISTPAFWTGILLLAVFSFHLHWFPVLGEGGVRALVLPWLTLTLSIAGVLAQVTREGMERALDQPFTLTARSRGAGENRVRLRHALRHAALPLLTLSGWVLGELLGGVVVVEAVFARQGLGQVIVTAVAGRDFPVVTGVVVLAALTFALISAALDVLYRAVDPRLRRAAT